MQDEFRSDAEDLKAGVAIWVHALVENDIVSVTNASARMG
jgi:hypothetical protein